jgi:hypothetical protein
MPAWASPRCGTSRSSSASSRSLNVLFEQLDFVYLPSRDVATDTAYYTDELGAELVFAIEAFGTRVAMVRLSPTPPALLLAGHLEGNLPILVHRVDDLDDAIALLQERGARVGSRFGIPHGTGVELITPGPQRLAVYELSRPDAAERLAGRRDF